MGLSNQALDLFVDDVENFTPEWKRGSASIYSGSKKLLTDLDVPDGLRNAAENYVIEYDKTFPPIPKNVKRKV